jgi:thiopeptide-type bacteriocin biosynthesis protein
MPADLDLSPTADPEPCRDWLARTWQHPEMQVAVWLASPDLAKRITTVLARDAVSPTGEGRALNRLAMTLACYVLRWQCRPTPFGMFAGVTAVSGGHAASACFGTDHRIRARPDGSWLASLIAELEKDPALLARLPFMASNTAVVRGGRLVIEAGPADTPEPGPLTEISVRYSRPVRLALTAAAGPVRFSDLADLVTREFPNTGREKVNALLVSLVERGFLISALRPPATVVDTLAYLTNQMRAAGLPGTDLVRATLPDIAAGLRFCDRPRSQTAVHASLVQVTQEMKALADRSDPVLATETAVDGRIALPGVVLREAARAADVLVRTTAQPFGSAAWTDYHVAFRERYGPGARVPLRELVVDSGLGYPAGFLGAACARAARPVTDRDAVLLALLQETSTGGGELVLTEQVVSALATGSPDEAVLPDRVELAFEVRAGSCGDIDRGRFELWITGAPRSCSSMAGRFASLLTEGERARLAVSFASSEGTLNAQLSFSPRRLHNDNVARVPRLLPALISLGEHWAPENAGGAISLDDLAVTADATQMYLIHAGTGQLIRPQVLHALEGSVHTPPLARFLAEITAARHAVYGPFDFGAARTLPHLPRIRYGKTVIAPARWILRSRDLPAPGQALAVWENSLNAWRSRWRVPRYLTIVQGDLRLPLDADCRAHRTILRTRLDRAGTLEIREAPDPAGQEWAGRACEFLVPLTLAVPTAARLPHVGLMARPAPWTPPGRGEVIHALVLGHPARYSGILTSHVPQLLDLVSGDVLRWWFRRYRDITRPDGHEHLSLFLRLTCGEVHGAVAAKVADFAADLHGQGLLADLTLRPYQPQTGRYGPDEEAAERVASADSAAALAQITMADQAGVPLQAITAASMTRIAASLAPDARTGYQWIADRLPRAAAAADRSLRDTAIELASSGDCEVRHRPGGGLVAGAWQARHVALIAYRDSTGPFLEPVTVLRSLLHDQYVRAMGVDPDAEAITNQLARAAALRGLALAEAAP